MTTRAITKKEFDQLLTNIPKKYIEACKDVFLYGDKLGGVSKKYNFNRRSFQYHLKNNDTCYLNLRYGYMATQLSKGYTTNSIRKSMGMSIKRPLNSDMWQKVRGDIRPSVRWRILKRDNFRCVLCGANATDRKLHIDHIIPVSRGGTSRIKNLRVLCECCNIGRNTDLNKEIADFAQLKEGAQHTTINNSGA